jgi:AbrB family looped-hinge helix DNA binding protein
MNMTDTPFYKSRIRAKGQVTIPGQVREYLGVAEGDDLTFSVNKDGQVVVERLQVIPPDQAWFWTERWQKMEREAQADIDAGRVTRFANIDAAMDALESRGPDHAAD